MVEIQAVERRSGMVRRTSACSVHCQQSTRGNYDRPRRSTSKGVASAQPFSLRILTLILFMEEAVKDQFGEETMNSFDRDLKEAYRKLPSPQGEAN